jgi:hypothetical protein
MKPGFAFLAAVLALAAAACGPSLTINSTTMPSANLAKYHTFAWYAQPNAPQKPETIADQQIRASITQDLAQKGITEVTTGTPDFLVSYHVRERQQASVTPYTGWGWGWGYYGGGDVTIYTEGTLVVDFIDPTTNQVFWRGTASSVLENPNQPNLAKIDTAVSKLIAQYPSQLAAAPRPAM